MFGRILGEPLDDAWHVRLERTRNGKTKNPGPDVTSILEVVSDAARYKHERASGGVYPFFSHTQAHRAVDDIEDVILRVRMCAGALRTP